MTQPATDLVTAPAYVYARLTVQDFAPYIEKYAMPFQTVLAQFDGTVLSATTDAEMLEGVSDGNWTVLLQFPSLAQAKAFYHSDDYAPLIKTRVEELKTSGHIMVLPGMPPAV
ncbi:MAG: DUF1330 domain-containing protein [Alphaproteobacteria bacterium]